LDGPVTQITEDTIADRLRVVRERMAASALRAHRSVNEVQLVAVSKGQTPDAIADAAAAGQTVFGENYLEEATAKISALPPELRWHMTGHVQSRKAAAVAQRFAAIHSLDSGPLAERLSRFAQAQAMPVDAYLECNVSGEASKTGFDCQRPGAWEAHLPTWRAIAQLPGLRLIGWMTMAPYDIDTEAVRSVFRSLRALRDAACSIPELRTLTGLSMGMSDDFELAIEEGATCVRIGRAIFGPRKMTGSR
jgi:pyridoxal phosphate enzyme (YggS family)